ncbi:hypothetical protein ACFFOS_13510 [Nocardioides kongjuensis]|uniref:Uncharacterized protein n=1 Tax=Nocardioides kongjuensis TaxID=349522 RepID=A0A852RXP5_9ACTN|nr:hypothetical protein [Nocardioides kongjuensis]NYD32624.1 hypothetical protein [Nocardioides kongjuensis]
MDDAGQADELDERERIELGAVTPGGVEYRVVVAMRGIPFRPIVLVNPLSLLVELAHSGVARLLTARMPIRKVGVFEVRRDALGRRVHLSWVPSLDEALVLAAEICDEVAAGEPRWGDPAA